MDKGKPCSSMTRSECRSYDKRLPHYGTQVKKPLRLKSSGMKTSRHMECTPIKVVTLHAKRALSLQDLSPGFEESITLRRSIICQEDTSRMLSLPLIVGPSEAQNKILAFLVYCRFLKMVWRKRKNMSEKLEIQINSSNIQTKNLRAQIESLKSLLTSDEQIISSSFREVQSLKRIVARLEAKYDLTVVDNEQLEARSQQMREDLLKTEAEASNNKNSFILAKNNISNLEVQLQKEKGKSAKLKKENKILLSKIDNLSKSLKGKCEALEICDHKVVGLQDQLKSQLLLLKESRVKVEHSDRILESAQRQLDIVHTRMKEEKMAYEVIIQDERMKSSSLETQLALLKAPPLKTKIIMLTDWILTIPLTLATW